jgi:hypothetical protein
MNSTKTTLAIAAVLTAATLVVGLTVAATMTSSAFAGGDKGYGQDKYMKGKGQDSYKKDGKANGGKDNSSVVEQNGQNVICTHPGSTSPDNSCTSQNNGLPPA